MHPLLQLGIFYLLIFAGNLIIFGMVYLVGRRFTHWREIHGPKEGES